MLSGNELTAVGIGDVVQFARTQGCEATLIDLSKNQLDDVAALNELTRLVKNYGTFGSQSFIGELLLSSNKIGRAGASPTRPVAGDGTGIVCGAGCSHLFRGKESSKNRPPWRPPGSGVAGATKLIQYAHWERDRHTESETRPTLKMDLSDNCIADPEGKPAQLPLPVSSPHNNT